MDTDDSHELVLKVSRVVDTVRDAHGDEEPEWGPLEAVVPTAHCDGFMWMGHTTTNDGQRVECYKHGITRRYLVLDGDGRAYRFADGAQLEAIGAEAALDHVFAGLAGMGWTRETRYDDDFKATRNATLRQHGISTIS